MSDLSISKKIAIKIADKEYTVSIVPEDEKYFILATERLSAAIKAKKEQMRIADKTDLLAMVAFDCIFDQIQTEYNQNIVGKKVDAMQQRVITAMAEDIVKKNS
jgi:cell division protein ZapA